MEPIRGYRYYGLSPTGNIQGMMGANWRDRQLTAVCTHAPELAECGCGIYGRYGPINEYRDQPILTSCFFFGRVVVASEGVRATKARIEAIWLIADNVHKTFSNVLSEETKVRIHEEIGYFLSARYGLPVTVIEKNDLEKLAVYDVPQNIPDEFIVGRFSEASSDSPMPPLIRKLTLKERSRLARSLAYAAAEPNGIVKAAVLRGLHCKEWRDCIHGVTGYATFIGHVLSRYRVFVRVKRGSYQITDRGRALLESGVLDYEERRWSWVREVFVPVQVPEPE